MLRIDDGLRVSGLYQRFVTFSSPPFSTKLKLAAEPGFGLPWMLCFSVLHFTYQDHIQEKQSEEIKCLTKTKLLFTEKQELITLLVVKQMFTCST